MSRKVCMLSNNGMLTNLENKLCTGSDSGILEKKENNGCLWCMYNWEKMACTEKKNKSVESKLQFTFSSSKMIIKDFGNIEWLEIVKCQYWS
jgi:hypothetical protein